jgi:uncharacterized cupredoxin-like copper-binding protein
MAPPTTPARRFALLVAGVAGVLALASIAACGGDDDDSDLPAVEGETSPRMEVTATEMKFDPDAVAVAAGDVEVVLHNDGTVLHDLHIEGEPLLLEAGAGQTVTDGITLEPGRYEFFCGLPGHKDAGMHGVLEVR